MAHEGGSVADKRGTSKKAKRRFGSDYVKTSDVVTPDEVPDHLPWQAREWYAQLNTEERQWNALWYSEDHDDVRRDQRRFFLQHVELLEPNVIRDLYRLMPPFRRVLARLPASLRTDLVQSMATSFYYGYFEKSDHEREVIDGLIDQQLAEEPDEPEPPGPPEFKRQEGEWQSALIIAIELPALKSLQEPDAESENDPKAVDERYMIIYKPLYRWLRRHRLLTPWAADVALSTLTAWYANDLTETDRLPLWLRVRPKRILHNLSKSLEPNVSDEDFRFTVNLDNLWDRTTLFSEFKAGVLNQVTKALEDFKANIDTKMFAAGYKLQPNSKAYDVEPFYWLALYQVRGLSFDELAAAYNQDNDISDIDEQDKTRERIEKAVRRVAQRIGLPLRRTN